MTQSTRFFVGGARPLVDAPEEIHDADARLAALSLDDVRTRLAHPTSGTGWDEATLDLAEREYRRFLALCIAWPAEPMMPCRIVDGIWQAHRLNTEAYHRECARLFQKGSPPSVVSMVGRSCRLASDTVADAVLLRYREAFGDPPAASGHLDHRRPGEQGIALGSRAEAHTQRDAASQCVTIAFTPKQFRRIGLLYASYKCILCDTKW
jgi:hypothetical protein